MISIISPFKDVERFIEPFIKSIQEQTFKNWELILINDLSNQETLKIAKKYESAKIKIINNKYNVGLGHSRNIGLKYSKYDYVMFVDSDDMITKNFLDGMFKMIKQNNSDIVISPAKRCDENGQDLIDCNQNKKLFNFKVDAKLFIFEKLPNRIPGMLIRKNFLLDNKILFSKYNLVHEDTYFTPQLFIHSTKIDFFTSKTDFYIWRNRSGSLSNVMTWRRYISQLIIPLLMLMNLNIPLKYKCFCMINFFIKVISLNYNLLKIYLINFFKNSILCNFDFFYVYGEKKLSKIFKNLIINLRYRFIYLFQYFDKNLNYVYNLKNKYKNQDCIILCNGPSLKDIDPKKIEKFVKFGFNAIYLNKDYSINYHLIEDVLVAEDRREDLIALKKNTILVGNYLSYLFSKKLNHFKWFNVIYDFDDKKKNWPKFSTDAGKKLYTGGTVTYIALQLAYYMGFKRIFILGMDHKYKVNNDQQLLKGTNILYSSGNDINHFDPNYFGKGYRWHLPRTDRMLKAYNKSMTYFKKNKIDVYRVSASENLKLPFKHLNIEDFYEMTTKQI